MTGHAAARLVEVVEVPGPRPSRRAIAVRWMTALVEPPIALSTRAALTNPRRPMREGRTSSRTISTMRDPRERGDLEVARVARGDRRRPRPREAQRLTQDRPWSTRCPWCCTCHVPRSAPLRTRPTPRRRACPRAARPTRATGPCRCRCVGPGKCAEGRGPDITNKVGRSVLKAPISPAGTDLSQAASTITPSRGWQRSDSSTSMATRLRYSIAAGFMMSSPRLITGNSTATPPADSIPSRRAGTRSRRG